MTTVEGFIVCQPENRELNLGFGLLEGAVERCGVFHSMALYELRLNLCSEI